MQEPEASVSYLSLIQKFELTKKELGEAEETIKRLTGRDPELFNNGPGGRPNLTNKGKLEQFNRKRTFDKQRKEEDAEKDVFGGRGSPDEDETDAKKPSLQSTVIATKDKKSRKDSIQEQNVNSKVKARNRRMMGMILGTLQKFQHEAKKRLEQDLKRAEIEQKVEAAAIEERERIKKEKEELFQTRKEKQIQLRCLEKKIEIAELHEAWENSHKPLQNFIKTTAKPYIFFMPASHTPESTKRLEESKNKTLELIQQHKEKMEKDIAEVEDWYKKDHFPSDKENIGPLENESLKAECSQPEETVTAETNESLPPIEAETVNTAEEDERTNENVPNLTDQEFEPIYD